MPYVTFLNSIPAADELSLTRDTICVHPMGDEAIVIAIRHHLAGPKEFDKRKIPGLIIEALDKAAYVVMNHHARDTDDTASNVKTAHLQAQNMVPWARTLDPDHFSEMLECLREARQLYLAHNRQVVSKYAARSKAAAFLCALDSYQAAVRAKGWDMVGDVDEGVEEDVEDGSEEDAEEGVEEGC